MILHQEKLQGIQEPIPDCVLFIDKRAKNELGLDTLVVFGYRSNDLQNAIWAQGRGFSLEYVNNLRAACNLYPLSEEENKLIVTYAIGGESAHNFEDKEKGIKGAAVDLVGSLNGEPQWKNDAFFKIVGEEAEKLGLTWGVVHKGIRVDLGHIEIKNWKPKS